jgi:putative endonuclease
VVNTRRTGELGERIAAAFLAIKGYQIIDTNYRFARREIDLVARDGAAVVAVEVKLRRGGACGVAAQAIDRRKLARIEQALAGMMRDMRLELAPRVDVVAIDLDRDGRRMVVEHFRGVY